MTEYEMRISDWSSDVCSSDLFHWARGRQTRPPARRRRRHGRCLLIFQPFLLRFTGLGKIVDLSIIELSKVKSMAETPAPQATETGRILSVRQSFLAMLGDRKSVV